MYKYNKKDIDKMLNEALHSNCTVQLVKLSEEDINRIKLSLIKKNDKTSKIKEPAKKKLKLETSGGEVDLTKSTKNSNLLVGKIVCRNYRTMIDEPWIKTYIADFLKCKPNSPTNNIKKPVLPIKSSPSVHEQTVDLVRRSQRVPRQTVDVVKPSPRGHRQTVNGDTQSPNGINLQPEQLYTKYFTKFIQDNIVTIANILNIIGISNNYHKACMGKSSKENTKSKNLNKRFMTNQVHEKHRRSLEAKLKEYFSIVVTTFEDVEFDSIFTMFFLSIFTVLEDLDEPRLENETELKNLVFLLWKSLKSSEFENTNVYKILVSKQFLPSCHDLKKRIEDISEIDPGIKERMPLFFVLTFNSREHFQAVIHAVTHNYKKDLGILIDDASIAYRKKSKFKDPVALAVRHSSDIIPVTSNQTIQLTVNKPRKKPARSINIPIKKGCKTQTNGNTTVATNLYKTVSNSTEEKVKPSTNNNPLRTTTTSTTSTTTTPVTLVDINPSIHNMPGPSNYLENTDCSLFVGQKQFKLVTSGQKKSWVHGQTVLMRSPPSKKKEQCDAKNCVKEPTVMCSGCNLAKYCSKTCQKKDWYDNHYTKKCEFRQTKTKNMS